MECFLEHLNPAHCALVIYIIQEACTDVVGSYQHGASVHTLTLSLNVSNGNGKSLRELATVISAR